ncbi:RASF5 protein, partial [Atractosteus spatula]|nr:RASF5 protein [Atractosteus spatula]
MKAKKSAPAEQGLAAAAAASSPAPLHPGGNSAAPEDGYSSRGGGVVCPALQPCRVDIKAFRTNSSPANGHVSFHRPVSRRSSQVTLHQNIDLSAWGDGTGFGGPGAGHKMPVLTQCRSGVVKMLRQDPPRKEAWSIFRQQDPRVKEEKGEGHVFAPGKVASDWCDACNRQVSEEALKCKTVPRAAGPPGIPPVEEKEVCGSGAGQDGPTCAWRCVGRCGSGAETFAIPLNLDLAEATSFLLVQDLDRKGDCSYTCHLECQGLVQLDCNQQDRQEEDTPSQESPAPARRARPRSWCSYCQGRSRKSGVHFTCRTTPKSIAPVLWDLLRDMSRESPASLVDSSLELEHSQNEL